MITENEAKNELENETEDTETHTVPADQEPSVENTEPEVPELSAAAQILQAALNKDAVTVADVFNNEIVSRIADRVDDRKQYIAQNLLAPDQPEEQEQETEEPESNENTETDTEQGDGAEV